MKWKWSIVGPLEVKKEKGDFLDTVCEGAGGGDNGSGGASCTVIASLSPLGQ